MSLPINSTAPQAPQPSSLLRPIQSISEWFRYITDWIKGMSPANASAYNTGWWATSGVAEVITIDGSNWTVNAFAASRIGFDVDLQMQLTYTGPTVTVPSNGDISNVNIGTMANGFRPRFLASLTSATIGPGLMAGITTGGFLAVNWISPGTSFVAGTVITLQGMYRIPSGDRT